MSRLTAHQFLKKFGPAAAAQAGLRVSKGPSKYNVSADATTRTVGGHQFDSKLEAELYQFLVSHIPPEFLRLQVPFQLVAPQRITGPDGNEVSMKGISFTVDFAIGRMLPLGRRPVRTVIPEWKTGLLLLDAKGKVTRDYVMRKKMLAEKFGLCVHEVTKQKGNSWWALLPVIQKFIS